MRLVVVNAVRHYPYRGELWAYGPYVREIEMWADLFSTVRIAAPCRRHEKPPGDCLPIRRTNVSISPKIEVGGHGLLDKIPFGAAFQKGLTFKMGQTNMHKYMPHLLLAIEAGTIDPSFVISHRMKLSEAPLAYEKFNAEKDPWRKVVLSPN